MSDAYEKAGEIERAVGMLSLELKQVRGPRRIEVQRRLGILRQDALGDLAGALELLAPVVAGDPGDDALRARLVELSLALNQPAQAARLLSRALTTSRDAAVRARVAVDVGDVYLKSGDAKKAQAAFQQVLEIGADSGATLVAARRLSEIYGEGGELKQLALVLEKVVELEPEREVRQAAARRLARSPTSDLPDPARAIVAFRALVGSPWTDEALRRLEELYTEQNDEDGLADVLAHRADRTKRSGRARELAFKAAELRTLKNRDRAGDRRLARLAARYGASPEITQLLKLCSNKKVTSATSRAPPAVSRRDERATARGLLAEIGRARGDRPERAEAGARDLLRSSRYRPRAQGESSRRGEDARARRAPARGRARARADFSATRSRRADSSACSSSAPIWKPRRRAASARSRRRSRSPKRARRRSRNGRSKSRGAA